MNTLKILVDFIEGTTSHESFENILYTDKSVEKFLSEAQQTPAYIAPFGNIYDYLINLNWKAPDSIVNAMDIIERVLVENKVDFNKNNKYRELHNILLKAQPKWLDLKQDFLSFLVEKSENKNGKDLENWLKTEIASIFKSANKPPKWLQSPEWPIEENKPLLFLGQIDASSVFHDKAQVYVFYNKSKNTFRNITQIQ